MKINDNALTTVKMAVKFVYIKDVYAFVEKASRLKNIPLVTQGNIAIPASSLLGMFTIDPSQPFTVTFNIEEADFNKFLTKFMI